MAGDMVEAVHDVATMYAEVLVREANTNLAIKCQFTCECLHTRHKSSSV